MTIEAARALRARIDARAARVTVADKLLADELADADIVAVTPLFDEWATATAYSIGDIVVYDDDPYKCVQAHTSQADWTPPQVPALFTPLRNTGGDTPDPWVQPTGAQDAYQIGDRVTYNGAVYESTIDVTLPSGEITRIDMLSLNGSDDEMVIVRSSSSGIAATIENTGEIDELQYVDIQDIVLYDDAYYLGSSCLVGSNVRGNAKITSPRYGLMV